MDSLLDRVASFLKNPRFARTPTRAPSLVNQIQQNRQQPARGIGTPQGNQLFQSITNSRPVQHTLQNIANTRVAPLHAQKNQAFPTLSEYFKGQIQQPWQEGKANLQSKDGVDKVMGGAQMAGAAFSSTPVGALFNFGFGVGGGIGRSVRTGEDLEKSVRRGIAEPTGLGAEGLGIENPVLAMGVDIAASGPKGLVSGVSKLKTLGGIGKAAKNIDELAKQGQAMGIKGVNPRAFKMHAEDAADLEAARDILKAGKGDITGAQKTVQNILDAYLPGYRFDSTKRVNQATDWLLDVHYKVPQEARTSLPKMGIVDDAGQTAGRSGRPLVNTSAQQPPATPADYVRNQVAQQKAARGGDSIMDKLRGLRGDIKRKFVDETAVLEDILNSAEKKGKFAVIPKQDIRYQIDKAIRADTLATQFVKDHKLDQLIKQVPDLDTFNQYLIARHAATVSQKGIKTGRNAEMDRRLVQELGEQYEPFARQIKTYNDALLDYKVQSGFISDDLARALRREYPDYVPLNRVFSEIEEQAGRAATGRGGPASVGTQNVLKRLRGSEREIQNPLESMMEATATAFREGERNRAAQMLVGYEKLPGNPFNLRRLAPGEVTANKHTVSAFVNGQKVTFETLPEVAEAARNLNPQQFGLLGQIFAVPTRMLRIGATGLNVPFVLTNLVRDQVFSSVVSQKAMSTSLANPANFGRALYHAIGYGKLYDDWVKSGSSFTQFDIGRNQVAPTIARIRGGRSTGSKIAYTAKNPGELLRALEDVIGRSEEVTRLQQFGGTRDALLKQGRTATDAELMAGAASRYNTANFGRKGDWSKVVNGVIPFFSAGIAGARSFVRAATQDPKGTAVRFSVTIGVPAATATLWNLSDPLRREAYADIPDFEKENNLIILPPNPQRDENGNWNAIKIPVTPGLSNLMSMVRRQVEGVHGIDNGSAGEALAQVIGDVTAATTSLEIDEPRKLISNFTPQALKPGIETVLNKNLFTGQDIVPSYMKNLPAEEQVRPNTSGTARLVGRATNTSPLMIENAVGTAFAGVGRQLLNLSDRTLTAAGTIPEEQIGGRSVSDDLKGRFTVARGGQKASELYADLDRQKGENQARNNRIREAYLAGDTAALGQLTQGMTKQQLSAVLSSANERTMRDSLTPEQRAIQSYSKAQREELKATRPDLLQDILSVERAERGGVGEGQLVGNFYSYMEDGSQKLIDLDFTVEAPELTGKAELDKKRIASYKSKLTSKANDIAKLYELGVVSAEEAEMLLQQLQQARGSTGSGGTAAAKKQKQALATLYKNLANQSLPEPGSLTNRRSSRVETRTLGSMPALTSAAAPAGTATNAAALVGRQDVDALIRRYAGR